MSARESQVERDTVVQAKADSEPVSSPTEKGAQALLSAQFYLELIHPAQNQQLPNIGIGSANT